MMASSLLLLYGRRLCIIIAVIILLFLPLTFSANNNSASATDVSIPFSGSTDVDPQIACLFAGLQCEPPDSPEPRQSLDCNQLGTCPTNPSVVPAPRKPPTVVDLNEWKRDNCRDFREGLYFIACGIIGTVVPDRFEAACDELGVLRKLQCFAEYPRTYGIPPAPSDDWVYKPFWGVR